MVSVSSMVHIPMKTSSAVLSCLFVLSVSISPAIADDDRRGGKRQSEDERSEQRGGSSRGGEPPRWSTPNFRPGNEEGEGRRQGKMSPDERRALRRQIDEAGSELYRPRK